jgi:hypothetical protein
MFKPFKRLKLSAAVERSEAIERFERGLAKHVLSKVEGAAKGRLVTAKA